MKVFAAASLGLALIGASAASARAVKPQFPPERNQERRGVVRAPLRDLPRYPHAQSAVGDRSADFPRDAHARFVDSVTNGKRNMPPWDDVLDPEEIEALWAYVIAGEPGD